MQKSAENGRVPHAQLFVGKEGSGTLPMAIAYAQFLLCNFSDDADVCNIKCNKLQHPDLHFAFPVTSNASFNGTLKSFNVFIGIRVFNKNT